jgi:hypothetical protein
VGKTIKNKKNAITVFAKTNTAVAFFIFVFASSAAHA